ncbi:uncharacterized protein EDB91DRAFT_1156791 [Suillus paluster]|uniref:uncharacterized protein n=1 Tax=Suillus paluster TaxID=48578 RepID=UPI001B86466C|nr:uncharacterized protein EDB91DRAFT_1156791 [Suillus paluster]KAG1730514.1 hypothetical protein EDB91DRAFT_1156791 [Suillus paluster]
MSWRTDKINGGWRQNGNRFRITDGPTASTPVVYTPERGSKGIIAFIIEKRSKVSPHAKHLIKSA